MEFSHERFNNLMLMSNKGQKKIIEVVAAVILNEGEILCVQRGESKLNYISEKWEFPGGKLESGESEVEALKREIKEELNLKIEVKDKLITVNHEYPDFIITMHTYECVINHRDINLLEHINFCWREKNNLTDLDWAAADIPIVDLLSKNSD